MAQKKRVAGVVDRVEGDTAVVVFKDPDSGDNREVYVNKKTMKKVNLKEGDEVTVEMTILATEEKSDTVSLVFSGVKTGEMAKRFFSYLVDGGLEDLLIDRLSGKGLTLEITDCNKKTLAVTFQCSKETPVKAKKPVPKKGSGSKKPARKQVSQHKKSK